MFHIGYFFSKDFKNSKIAKIFDRNGNGKADLIGCNLSWDCGQEIEPHLSAYGLNDTVEQVQGDYSPMMAETIEWYKRGAPVFFYTWTPNWTIGALVPGQDVVWIEVPFPSLAEGKKHAENQITVKGRMGRFFALIWMLAGYFVFAYFTDSVTSTVTLQERLYPNCVKN